MSITIDRDTLRVRFDRFDLETYQTFLKVKRLPEYTLDFDQESEAYTVSAPARFATLLGVQVPGPGAQALPFSQFLFDDQLAITQMALDAKRFACWSDCGLGKTLIQLEFARHVMYRTHGRVMIVTLNEIVGQTIEECRKFYGDRLPIFNLSSRDQMRVWSKGGLPDMPRLGITNYEKFNPDREAGSIEEGQVVNELRYLAGIVLDESNRLAAGGGKQKWAIIKSSKGIEYKLSCTATPAPNDTIEFASQASFLERMRSEGDIIWTYFVRDPKSHRWTVKRHARKAFFEFMSAWSIYVRDPRRYGWRKNLPEVPAPTIITHELKPTAEQMAAAQRFNVDANGQRFLLQERDLNTIQRGKLSQIAKGFVYLKGEKARKVERIKSRKPAFVADLIHQEVDAGLQVLVWTVFDAESDLIAEEIKPGLAFDLLTGATSADDRLPIIERFRHGESRVLISRASMLGFGMNFQCCGSMIFSGWSDSYVQWYQAIRRAYRFGQTKSVRVHVPVITDLEGDMLENIQAKGDRNEADITEMEQNYIAALRSLRGEAVA